MYTIAVETGLLYRPSRKYVTLEGEGVCEGVTVCDRGRGSKEYVTSHFAKKIMDMKPEIESYCITHSISSPLNSEALRCR